jgi:hypothetical protein
MLELLFDIFIGKYAVMVSGALGILGSVALALPPIESLHVRVVLLQLDGIQEGLSEEAYKNAKHGLTSEARRLLKRERRLNMIGAFLLIAAFVILFTNATYCTVTGTCT